ncbi:hypothetical protein N8303_02020 [Gammaproteobacteria bacterium]|jgi:3-deoxy-D-arabino-heptulosonate 7-phosphate (DAHP) synthase|nr:hypothetical protein [Gammaproteobacteria bacterium]
MKNLITENINISSYEKRMTPDKLKARLPLQKGTLRTLGNHCQIIRNILDHKNHEPSLVIEFHRFLHIDPQTNISPMHTTGNPYIHRFAMASS